ADAARRADLQPAGERGRQALLAGAGACADPGGRRRPGGAAGGGRRPVRPRRRRVAAAQLRGACRPRRARRAQLERAREQRGGARQALRQALRQLRARDQHHHGIPGEARLFAYAARVAARPDRHHERRRGLLPLFLGLIGPKFRVAHKTLVQLRRLPRCSKLGPTARRPSMNKPAEGAGVRSFFSASQDREERWRELHRVAKGLAAGGQAEKLRQEAQALVTQLSPLEALCGYPGARLMAQLSERLKDGDGASLARLTQRISMSLLSNSYRDDPEAWKSDQEEDDPHIPKVLPPSIGRGQARKPYCEVLIVSPGERSTWGPMCDGIRRLRRDTDQFVVEPVVVGSFEDAVLAVLVNYNIQAVVMFDGFGYEAQAPLPDLRELVAAYMPQAAAARDGDLAMLLSRAMHAIRPELDVYLSTDRDVAKLAGADEAAGIRRVFYALEEMLELHLAILEGIAERYETPYFDNL